MRNQALAGCFTCGETLFLEPGECGEAPRICSECRQDERPMDPKDRRRRTRLDLTREAMELHLAEHRRRGDFDDVIQTWLDGLVMA